MTEEIEPDDEFVSLTELPPEHPLRNTSLAQIGAEYQWTPTKLPKQWHRVTRSFTIGKATFNELGATWTESYRWRAKRMGS